MAIQERWEGVSHSDRLRQEREEETQPERDLQTRRRTAFGFRDWEDLSR
jgi:hypothetical protein